MGIAGATYREGVAYSPDGAIYVTPTGTAAITSGTITGTNVDDTVATWGVPFIKAPTGSMGNNGAVTMGTALGRIYSGGAWVYYPAGAVAAGVPAAAAWLWTVMSSTTVGTVYNSTYTTGTPTLGTQTAYSTTGPGAFTGVTTEVVGPSINIAANTMGIYGSLEIESIWYANNTAGVKTAKLRFGGVAGDTYLGISMASSILSEGHHKISNIGVANAQIGSGNAGIWGVGTTASSSPQPGTQNTAADTALVFTMTVSGAATDWQALEFGKVKRSYRNS